jgi:hypothetical protein
MPDEILNSLEFLSVMDISHTEIIGAIDDHLNRCANQKYLIIIDHILNMVLDMNSTSESTQMDQFLKKLISKKNILIVSIHKPNTGYLKGLGHIGATLQRLASFILDISNNESGDGFEIKQIKSRISAKNKCVLSLTKDQYGNIDMYETPKIAIPTVISKKVINHKKILAEFIVKGSKFKKELLELIRINNEWEIGSSSIYTCFNNHFNDLISFDKTGYILSETAINLLQDESI